MNKRQRNKYWAYMKHNISRNFRVDCFYSFKELKGEVNRLKSPYEKVLVIKSEYRYLMKMVHTEYLDEKHVVKPRRIAWVKAVYSEGGRWSHYE